MSLTAILLILFSVSCHALWNLVAKKSRMSVAFYTLLSSTTTLLMCNVFFWTPVKYSALPLQFYLLLICTIVSDVAYCFGLLTAYRKMDMSSAYPAMRSLPLIFTTILTAAFGWGEPLPLHATAGVILAFAGCIILPLKKLSDFDWKFYLSANMFAILLAACGTTGYTMLDSAAQKVMIASGNGDVSKPVISMSYYAIRCFFLNSTLTLITFSVPAFRKDYLDFWKKRNLKPLFSGFAAALSYLTVLMAMNFITNVTYIQMLRLLALPVGLLVGVVFLKESPSLPKFAGVALILAGLIAAAV